MTLSNILTYIGKASSKDIFQVLRDVNEVVAAWAKQMDIGTWVLFLVGFLLAGALGFFAYKLIKLILAIGFAYIGYFVGDALAAVIGGRWEAMPGWLGYVIGALVAILFLYLSFVKFSYALFSVSAVAGYCVTLFYFDDQVLAIGGAILLALLSVSFIRTVFVLVSSFVCGMLCASFLAGLLPSVEFLQMGDGKWISFGLSWGFTVIFAVVQFVINRRCSETVEC